MSKERLIDADVVVKDIADLMLSPWFCAKEGFHWRKEAVEIVRDLCVIKAPTVEAEPVRHGKWKRWDEDDYGDTYECTSCGEAFVMLEGSPIENGYHYCPYCGAKMDKRKKE